DAALLPLQMQEMTARIRRLGSPETKFLTTESGGTDTVEVSPEGTVGTPRTLLPGKPKTLAEQYEDPSLSDEDRKKVLGKEADWSQASHKLSPMQQAEQDYS